MRLAQSENGSDLGNCCETVTQFISQSPAALEQCVATKPVLGTLEEGGASFQTTHWTEISHARHAESSTQSAEARYLPLRWGDDLCIFCPKLEESMNGKKISCWPQFS
jgi:hypothetical protein